MTSKSKNFAGDMIPLNLRCYKCRKLILVMQFSPDTLGTFIRKCKNTRCGALNYALFFKGKAYPITAKILKKKQLMQDLKSNPLTNNYYEHILEIVKEP